MPYISRVKSGISVLEEFIWLQYPERCVSEYPDVSGCDLHYSVEYNSMILAGVFYAASTFGTYRLSTVFK